MRRAVWASLAVLNVGTAGGLLGYLYRRGRGPLAPPNDDAAPPTTQGDGARRAGAAAVGPSPTASGAAAGGGPPPPTTAERRPSDTAATAEALLLRKEKEFETKLRAKLDALREQLRREKDAAIMDLQTAQEVQLAEMREYYTSRYAEKVAELHRAQSELNPRDRSKPPDA